MVANFFGITSDEIMSRSRRQRIAMARHVTFYIMRRVGMCSYPQIGKAFGYDHTTILSAVDRIERLVASDEDIRFAVTTLSRYLVEAINGTAERPNHFWGS
jgi:chromosomal replication initiator protein